MPDLRRWILPGDDAYRHANVDASVQKHFKGPEHLSLCNDIRIAQPRLDEA